MGLQFRPGGVVFRCDGYTTVEMHASTCSHCQHVTEFPSRREMMNHVEMCRGCMKLICLECLGKPCVTWLKQCDIEEAVYRRQFYGNLREF